jgi:hypothetical protein
MVISCYLEEKMEFRLTYRGPLKGNAAKSSDKHELRLYFHKQLEKLWDQEPLKNKQAFLNPNPPKGKTSLIEKIEKYQFAPIISPKLHLFAELEILFMRSEPKGFLITDGGDIDNRLKTLLDGLRRPRNRQEIPSGDTDIDMPNPLFCLLEDDSLVTKVSVTADQLLEPIERGQIFAIINVIVKRKAVTYDNIDL